MADTDTIGFLVFVAALAAVFVAAEWQPRKGR